LLVHKSQENIRQLPLKFQSAYTDFQVIKTFMIDKDFNEMAMIRELFPSSKVLLCYFHIIKKLKAYIAKLHIDIERKKKILDLSKQVIYSSDETKFNENVNSLTSLNNDYWNYFQQNWLDYIDLWARYKRKVGITLLSNTNNIIESFYRVVKKEFGRRSKLSHLGEALTRLMVLLNLKSDVQQYNFTRQELTSFTINNTNYPAFIEERRKTLT
ncbi:unnamed protein product, partial [Didymodactylos carnosus]